MDIEAIVAIFQKLFELLKESAENAGLDRPRFHLSNKIAERTIGSGSFSINKHLYHGADGGRSCVKFSFQAKHKAVIIKTHCSDLILWLNESHNKAAPLLNTQINWYYGILVLQELISAYSLRSGKGPLDSETRSRITSLAEQLKTH